MGCNIVLIRKERPYASYLQDAFPSVHYRNFVLCHKLLSELLVVQPVGKLSSSCFRGVKAVDGFLTEYFRYVL